MTPPTHCPICHNILNKYNCCHCPAHYISDGVSSGFHISGSLRYRNIIFDLLYVREIINAYFNEIPKQYPFSQDNLSNLTHFLDLIIDFQ